MNEQEKIIEFLHQNFHQPQSILNKRYWTSYTHPDRDDWSHLTFEFANRTQCQFEINFGNLSDSTPNLVINLFTLADNDWMQAFWGNIESLEDLKFILTKCGIPFKL